MTRGIASRMSATLIVKQWQNVAPHHQLANGYVCKTSSTRIHNSILGTKHSSRRARPRRRAPRARRERLTGRVVLRIGTRAPRRTSVVAGVRAELGALPADPADALLLVANVELLPICSPRFLPGRPPELARAHWRVDERYCLWWSWSCCGSGGGGRVPRRAAPLLDPAPLVLSHLVPQSTHFRLSPWLSP
jgi:hypothetical protein